VTQFAPLNAEVIAGMSRAKVIVRYGIGVDNVDLEAARSRGIAVCNIPDYCVDEVADHTLAFILCSTRQVVPNTLLIQGGKWGAGGAAVGFAGAFQSDGGSDRIWAHWSCGHQAGSRFWSACPGVRPGCPG